LSDEDIEIFIPAYIYKDFYLDLYKFLCTFISSDDINILDE